MKNLFYLLLLPVIISCKPDFNQIGDTVLAKKIINVIKKGNLKACNDTTASFRIDTLTNFQWDSLYFIYSYGSKSGILDVIETKWDELPEDFSMGEGDHLLIFIKNKRVVNYVGLSWRNIDSTTSFVNRLSDDKKYVFTPNTAIFQFTKICIKYKDLDGIERNDDYKKLIKVFSYDKKRKIANEEYYNFSTTTSENDSLIKLDTELNINSNSIKKLTYQVTLYNNEEEDSLISSFFIIDNKKYNTSNSFKNSNKLKYLYSLMPKYADNYEVVVKSYNQGKSGDIILIKAENPFCNGTNCRTYYLHLLEVRNKKITTNIVYLLNSDEVNLEDLAIKYNKGKIIVLHRNKVWDTL